jgi:thiosulfate/3-mercaptopyruvate sulfurtransferase
MAGHLSDPDPEAQHPLLVTTGWLAAHIEDPALVLLDAGEAPAYRRAHLPGAGGLPHHYLKGPDEVHVMPLEEFETMARRLGVSNDSQLVLYDDNASLYAARAWWVFQRYGHEHVRVLDGGFNAWLDEGRPITSAPARRAEGDFTARDLEATLCRLDEMRERVAAGEAMGQIWDARSDPEWDGLDARGNGRAGHIPGAAHIEWRHLMQGPPARRFRPLEQIRATLLEAGIRPDEVRTTYCELGIRAAFAAFVLRLLGNDDVCVYDASMREWANLDDTPLVVERA